VQYFCGVAGYIRSELNFS